jgi:hypothetical protein
VERVAVVGEAGCHDLVAVVERQLTNGKGEEPKQRSVLFGMRLRHVTIIVRALD